jgi:D-apionate oxidoisomerase
MGHDLTPAVAVVGAAGKMGLRVSRNLERSRYRPIYSESSLRGRERLVELGRQVVDGREAAAQADIVVLAVPDIVLGEVSKDLVPLMRPGAALLTLDPAAAYAGVLARRDDVPLAVAHPCHPSIFLERTSPEQYTDTFGGESSPQDVVAAVEGGGPHDQAAVEEVVRAIYAPVVDVHWVTVKQLAVLEPTLVETIVCMISGLLKEALEETVNSVGVPEAAARAILLGHTQIALTNSLRGSNPFSEACMIAMDYGRSTIIRPDWKRVFHEDQLEAVIARMLQLDPPAVDITAGSPSIATSE